MRGPKSSRLALVIVLALGVVAVAPLSDCGPPSCPDSEDTIDGLFIEIGEFQSKDAAMRAAIKRLLVETQRCPNAQLYRIVWVGPFDDDPTQPRSVQRRALMYSGPEPAKWLGYEHDALSGTSGRTYLVDRAAIEAVAAKDGTLDDFDQYDQSPPSTRNDGG